jgi:transposase-like protein
VIVVAVGWYLRFGLSYRDVEQLLAERGVQVDHVTIYRWVRRFAPLLAALTPLCSSSGTRRFRCSGFGGCYSWPNQVVDLSGDVALETAQGLAAGLSFRRCAG